MRRNIFITLLVSLAVSFTASAHYSIHSATSGVKIESGANKTAATKGQKVKATDYLLIPEGGEVEIYNELDKNIYRSSKTGKLSVTRLMMDARKIASSNRQNVDSRLRFGKKGMRQDDGRRVYVEKGMVRRSLATYDPEAENIQMDSKTLGRYLAQQVLSGADFASAMPVSLTHGKVDDHGLFFKVVNNISFPVYFNILKVGGADPKGVPNVEISVLGQPDGSYVLLPGQSMTRENFNDLPDGERHIIVMTHCRYDLDEVMEEMQKTLAAPDFTAEDKQPLPVYILSL